MLANLRALLGVVFDILLLRRGPESLPASPVVLAGFVALYAILMALSFAALPKPPPLWLVQLLISIVVTVFSYHVACAVAKKRERFLQTTSAIFAVSALFAPAVVPMMNAMLEQSANPGATAGAPLLLFLCVCIWAAVVQIRIVRAALEWPIAGIIVFILAQEVLAALLFVTMFGAPAPSPV